VPGQAPSWPGQLSPDEPSSDQPIPGQPLPAAPYQGRIDPSQLANQVQAAEDREAEALHSLYRQAVHLTEPEPVYAPDAPITKMTHSEIRVMRAKTGVEVEVKVPFKETVINFVIRTIDECLQTFRRAGETRRRKCLDVGHECIHCGKRFALEPKKDKDKEGSG
jgi:hypothetical protein